MTIGAVVKVPGEGAVLVADGRVTDGALRILTDSCDKTAVLGSCIALVAGCDGRALQDLREAGVKSYAGVVEYCRQRQEEEPTWQLIVWDRPTQRIIRIDSSLSEIETGTSAFIGSGGDTAQGALAGWPRPKSLDEAAKQTKRAAKLACTHNAACGGRIRVIIARGKRKPLEIY
jgi:ATP-dependent protease HslVU (ClpYQ) peptidase subunit